MSIASGFCKRGASAPLESALMRKLFAAVLFTLTTAALAEVKK
jgi:hypothetical protein